MKLDDSVLLWFVRSLVLSKYLVEVLQRGVAPPEPEGVLVTRGEGEVVAHEGQVPRTRPLLRLGPPVLSAWTRRNPVSMSVSVNIEFCDNE